MRPILGKNEPRARATTASLKSWDRARPTSDGQARVKLRFERVASPVGTLLLVTEGEVLRALDFDDHGPRMRALLDTYYGAVDLVEADAPGPLGARLRAYFEGDGRALAAVAVATAGTSFQREVWAALRAIPFGATLSYGALAARLGRAGASRAVGLANGRNPIAIVVPCHRVIGADGSLTGFGGGLHRKRWLLAHEAWHAGAAPSLFPVEAVQVKRSAA